MYNNKSPLQKTLQFPLTKIIAGLVACISIGFLGHTAVDALPGVDSLPDAYKDMVGGITVAVLVLVAYIILYQFYEKRKITELSAQGLVKYLIPGILLGVALQSLTIYVMYLKKDFVLISTNSFVHVLPGLLNVWADSITAEIILIGIVFRIAEEKLGTYLALVIFAFIFGVIHFADPHGSLPAAVSISSHGAFLLGAAYVYTRSLWFPIAIHFAWDFIQAGVLGVSGDNSLWITETAGSPLITGGYFGPQASIQAGFFCLIAAIVFMLYSRRQNKILSPYWAK